MTEAANELESAFHHAMLSLYEIWRDRCGYKAIRFLQSVRRNGGLEAARRLLRRPGVSQGFIALKQCGALDGTLEALVVENPMWHPLFRREEIAVAERRLAEHGYALRPLPAGVKVKDLPAILASLPHLTPQEAEAFGEDIDAARDALSEEGHRDS